MRAQIVKINPKTVVIKNEKNVFATVQKTKLDFKYNLGDIITLEKNGDEIYYLPCSSLNFQTNTTTYNNPPVHTATNLENYNDKSLIGSIITLGIVLAGYVVLFHVCVFVAMPVFFYSLYHFSETKPSRKSIVAIILVISAIAWIFEVIKGAELGY